MNKEYIYHNGEVIIKDENNNQTLTEYYDNLDEVLVQENLIETMEDKIQQLEEDSNAYSKYNKKHYVPIAILAGLTAILLTPLMTFLFSEGDIAVFQPTVDTIFGKISVSLLMTITVTISAISFTSLLEISRYLQHKEDKNHEKGTNSELEYLKKQIVKEKEKLETLKKDKTKDKEDKNFRTVKVNDIEKLKSLKQYINIYYDLGYNGKKYYKYYQEGKLEQKLKKYYNESGIQLAEEYIQEKGPTFVKKKNKNIK